MFKYSIRDKARTGMNKARIRRFFLVLFKSYIFLDLEGLIRLI